MSLSTLPPHLPSLPSLLFFSLLHFSLTLYVYICSLSSFSNEIIWCRPYDEIPFLGTSALVKMKLSVISTKHHEAGSRQPNTDRLKNKASYLIYTHTHTQTNTHWHTQQVIRSHRKDSVTSLQFFNKKLVITLNNVNVTKIIFLGIYYFKFWESSVC